MSAQSWTLGVVGAVVIASAALVIAPRAQTNAPSTVPTPYRIDESWPKMPAARPLGSTIGIFPDKDGKSMWAFDRCGGATCRQSKIPPIMKFDASGALVAAFGAGLVNDSHGLSVDAAGNLWITDFKGGDGKGHQVFKLSPDGKVLMKLGKAGVAGAGPDEFNSPSDAIVAPNGDIFIADGHGDKTNDRIVQLSADGKFIKTWGRHGSGPGEFDQPHKLAMDSQGRLFVADRGNSRIQIFDLDGKLLDEWKQFGRPSGVFIDKKDVIYVTDSQSGERYKTGFTQGIRIGEAKTGKVTAYIPETKEASGPEGVAADDAGNVYGAYTDPMNLKRFVRN
jgi:sugar lactone lactonase YvrE